MKRKIAKTLGTLSLAATTVLSAAATAPAAARGGTPTPDLAFATPVSAVDTETPETDIQANRGANAGISNSWGFVKFYHRGDVWHIYDADADGYCVVQHVRWRQDGRYRAYYRRACGKGTNKSGVFNIREGKRVRLSICLARKGHPIARCSSGHAYGRA
ncbi:hypothetical protein [Streptomyces sp. NPDC127108]|uniref:hypothetical protein n=1 Tax=Streptomyces sp. NPDC127108 TaxID=3345361 RepID=UPI003635DC17